MNAFPKKNAITITVITLLVTITLALLLWLATPANAGPSLQPPRPTLPSELPGGGPGGIGEGEPGAPSGATIHGMIVNWNYHYEPHAQVKLRGGGWDLGTTSDDNGYYYFKGLGTDNVFLDLVLPEDSDLTPLATDLALRVKGSGQLVINLGFYTGPAAPDLPVDISMSIEPESALQGDTVLYTIQITNSLPYAISQILVTDYLPPGLAPVEATIRYSPVMPTPTFTPTPTYTPTPIPTGTLAPTYTLTPVFPIGTPVPLPPTVTPTPTPLPPAVEMWGNLVVAGIWEMAARDTALVTIEARVEDNVPLGTVIENRASFIYAEGIAVQAMAPLAIGVVSPTGTPTETLAAAAISAVETLTVTATMEGEELIAAAAISAAETPTTVVTSTASAAPTSPDGLPVTGLGLPTAGLLFVLLILIARWLRPRVVDES